jgi:23S rRNA (cytidine1920-2'-O)/16S rRNA (cytidine1409-2'-O)-methyltransferase
VKEKARLDQILVNRGCFPSRETARTAIMDGGILVNDVKVTKPGQITSCEAEIRVLDAYKPSPYVSRGGLKLEQALQVFQVDPQNLIAIDAGASTGGFTDCLLKHKAAFVYAIDVGHGQIAWSLRNHPQVKVLERTNIRYLEAQKLYGESQERAQLAVVDLSFISLSKIIASLIQLLNPEHFEIIALIKPQFEAGKDKIGKGGVIREASIHKEVLDTVIDMCLSHGLKVKNLTFSPIKGPSGNIEFLIHLARAMSTADAQNRPDTALLVAQAHSALNKVKEPLPE